MESEGGDPVCWLSQVCPECGAMPAEDSPEKCWRCGVVRPQGQGRVEQD
ncbi:hypothetical protein [Pseudonocardia ailaonensis]